MHTRHIHLRLGALLAAAFTILGAASVNAAPTSKPYSLNIQPGTPSYEANASEVASGETVSITATFTNETGTQQIGSANLFWPASFTVVGASVTSTVTPPVGTASIANKCSYLGSPAGPCVQVRSLSLPPGGVAVVTMSVTTPACQSGSNFPWFAEVKQANNYSGSPGNDLFLTNPSGDTLDTTLDGACSLRFGVEPTDARTNQSITGTAYSPTAPGLTVTVRDASGAVVTTSTAPVRMAVANNPVGSTLAGTATVAADGTDGTATFGNLSLNLPSFGYTVAASSGTLTGDTSTPFDIQDQAVTCVPNLDCPLTAGNPTNKNQLKIDLPATPGTGQLVESTFGKSYQASLCGSYTSTDPNAYESVYTPAPGTVADRTETDTITIVPAKKLPGSVQQILKAQQICFGNITDFVTASGAMATPTTLPDGKAGFVGLLPTCTGGTTGPCHNRQQDTTVPDPSSPNGFDLVLVADVPAAWTDYWRC